MTKKQLVEYINRHRIITEQVLDEIHEHTAKYCPYHKKGQCYKEDFGYQNCPCFHLRLRALGLTLD